MKSLATSKCKICKYGLLINFLSSFIKSRGNKDAKRERK